MNSAEYRLFLTLDNLNTVLWARYHQMTGVLLAVEYERKRERERRLDTQDVVLLAIGVLAGYYIVAHYRMAGRPA